MTPERLRSAERACPTAPLPLPCLLHESVTPGTASVWERLLDPGNRWDNCNNPAKTHATFSVTGHIWQGAGMSTGKWPATLTACAQGFTYHWSAYILWPEFRFMT